ncbi:MAG: TIGR03960 family B12-binding radical SAM protein [Gracilibacteraceae bacterium]|nr:TIGR03960 family B12-binding radical SAM protein [Gracilibacteraceae bacterium]
MSNYDDPARLRQALDRILPAVVKPGRYVGGEWNMARKDWAAAEARMAFLFPDVYEVAMSNLALRILYGRVNDDPRFLCERAFAPWPDMAAKMRAEGIPLYGLESFRPLLAFDALGVTLQYELSYTNILHMLDLAGIPRQSARRGQGAWPWLMAGGPGAFNPEPLAPFFDIFLLGDGEELLPDALALIGADMRRGVPRAETLRRLAGCRGVYAPAFYTPRATISGVFQGVKAEAPAPQPVRKAVVADLDAAYFPARCIVPYNETVHDRVMLEVMRGCTRGCRFCQAGMTGRPLRERAPAVLRRQARESVRATGYEEISLVSLSTGDYSGISGLLRDLTSDMAGLGVNVSLPSLRLDSFDVALAAEVGKTRKSGLTFAPEAGTQRLRDVINKGVKDEDLLRAAEAAFAAGWSNIKLYYMIGLPTETKEDLDGIAAQAEAVLAAGRRRRGKIKVTASVSNFVPKPHTPFQWAAQDSRDTFLAKQAYLREKLRRTPIKLHCHDADMSVAEAVLARGDRRIADLLDVLTDEGAMFDSWSEWFRPDLWRKAFSVTGLRAEDFTGARDLAAPLPWDHLSTGVDKEFLRAEVLKAESGERTEDCRLLCGLCGVCGDPA